MGKRATSKFSASDSMQGYLYQCRYALLLLLRRHRVAPSVRVSVEKFDDVAFEAAGQAHDLFQTKHCKSGNLTDLSEDLWKTLRIWSEGVRDNQFHLPGTVFNLITTQTAPAGSAAALLRPGAERDPSVAAAKLIAAARETRNAQLADACDVFLKLPAKKRTGMVQEVHVHDASARIGDVGRLLEQELYYAAPVDPKHKADFVRRLAGWWLQRVIRHLTAANQPPIAGIEVEREMERIKEGYTEDNLPVIVPPPEPPQPPDPANDPRTFVARLRRLGLANARVRQAILDFYRACVHRDGWVKGTLLRFNELGEYDDRLRGEWERLCDDLIAPLAGAGDDEKTRAGLELFRQIDRDAAREALFYIRPRCTEPSISRGTFHKLADEGKLAWHPTDVDAVRAAATGGGAP